jgi:predicted transcriptional regulator
MGGLIMKYTKEICDHMVQQYALGVSVPELAEQLDVPERSIIAKLSSLGVYQKKSYLNKRGEIPVKKSEHIERIAVLLNTNLELLESLEKVNKTVLVMIERALTDPKPPETDPEWT